MSTETTCSFGPPSWPVVVHSRIAHSPIGQHLKLKGIKVRDSETILEGSVIFPKAKVAFLILEVTSQIISELQTSVTATEQGSHFLIKNKTAEEFDLNKLTDNKKLKTEESGTGSTRLSGVTNKKSSILDRLDKFTRIHGHCYIVLHASLFTEKELHVFYQVQDRYLEKTSVDILTAHSAEDCINAMFTISSIQTPPKSDMLHQRYCQLMTDLVQPLPRSVLQGHL